MLRPSHLAAANGTDVESSISGVEAMSEQNQYIEVAQKHTDAMEAWRMIYAKQFPPPERRIIQIDNRIQIGTLLLVVVAAIVVSASHTIPVFMRGTGAITGIAAFVMLEFGLVALTYQRTREKTLRDGTNESSFKWITGAIGLTLFILLVGNVYYTAGEYGFRHPVADVFVVICVGVSAPALAFVSGEALALESVKALLAQRDMDAQYAADMLAYNAAFVASWDARRQKKWGANVSVERESEPVKRVTDTSVTHDTASKRAKPSPQMQKAIDYLILNPDKLDIPSRELQPIIGVSHMTIFRAQEYVKNKGGDE